MSVTTARVLAERALGRPAGRACAEWATAMLGRGLDGYWLARLAGEIEPFDGPELSVLRDHALRELGVAEPAPELALRDFAVECAWRILEDEVDILDTLATLRELDESPAAPEGLLRLHSFYSMHDEALDDVWFRRDGTRSTWLGVLREAAAEFLDHHGVPRLPGL